MLYRVCTARLKNRYFKKKQILEWVWSSITQVILFLLWVASAGNLKIINDIGKPVWSFKAIGHQWYWSYEFLRENHEPLVIESYIVKGDRSGYRLLDVDQRMVAPARTNIRLLVTRVDVLHSFALPSCFLKADCIPGRINQFPLEVDRTGVVYGQCSEICGVNHSFIPIVVEFVPINIFTSWLAKVRDQQLG